MKTLGFIFSIGLLATSGLISKQSTTRPKPSNEQVVRQFEAAFNKHDVAAMAALVSDDAQWCNVNGSKIEIEVEGKAAIEKWLTGYFKSCPSCRSEFESVMAAGSYVTVHERAMWDSKSGPKSQKSLGVYEVREGLIRRAWYYPAEK